MLTELYLWTSPPQQVPVQEKQLRAPAAHQIQTN